MSAVSEAVRRLIDEHIADLDRADEAAVARVGLLRALLGLERIVPRPAWEVRILASIPAPQHVTAAELRERGLVAGWLR